MTRPPSTRLSVVVPTHDTRELTIACVDSVVRCGAPPRDVVVVDDGSRDGTAAALAARHPGLTLLRNPRALGFTRAVNQGAAAAGGDVILLLNSDTEMPQDGLRLLAEAFSQRPRLGIAGAVLVYPDGRPQWNGGAAPTLAWMLALGSGLPRLLGRLRAYRATRPVVRVGPVDWVTGAALAVRRRVWQEVGPFDERFRFYGQDLDLCLRAGRAGWEVAVLPELRVVHHHGSTIRRRSATRQLHDNPELLWTDLLRWWEKERGSGSRRRAAAALVAGAALRLAARGLAGALLRGERRRRWREVTAVYRRSTAAVLAGGRGLDSPPE
ncbi:MAG TPA: glycosyltransferase family 2 protein [Thermoanaerobaculia bacterium]|nr:glycosyltransferase family 2 protein [Thermoanaerobaculia bacterium]